MGLINSQNFMKILILVMISVLAISLRVNTSCTSVVILSLNYFRKLRPDTDDLTKPLAVVISTRDI